MTGGYAVVDVETTGLHPGWHHRVVEVAVVRLAPDGRIVDEWATLVNPRRDLGPQHIHGITAAQVRRAPTFESIAGDLAARLAGHVVVAHNLSFDLRFIASEFGRIGIDVPVSYGEGLCTMHLAAKLLPSAGRSLAACCRSVGVRLDNAHSALHDARAAAGLMARYLAVAGRPVPWAGQLAEAARRRWPGLPTGLAAPVLREHAHRPEQHFLARLVDALPSVPDDPRADDYLAVLDAALIDRFLSESEQDELLAVATELELTVERVVGLHRDYLLALARLAWRDGVITDDERGDLDQTARLLGLTPGDVESALAVALCEAADGSDDGAQGHDADDDGHVGRWGLFALGAGDLVVFTGQMALDRDEWHDRAVAAGLTVNGGTVTRRTRLLVAADPDSLSGKARKARDYGIPIVTEAAFGDLLADLRRGGRSVR